MTRLPISVCIISGPEERRIGRALESVSGWTSEVIVVLNQEVQDGTAEIAGQHGAKVFRELWKGFRDQKNSAAQKAGAEWILGLDADEVVSPGLRDEIHRTFANEQKLERFAAFSFPRLCWCCGRWIRHGDWYPDHSVRLWRRGKAEWAGGNLHEKLRVNGPIGKFRADLYHYSSESINGRLQKIVPFSDEFVRQRAGVVSAPGVCDLAVRPLWRFVRAYFLRLGFLDGWPGFYIASHTAFSTLVRYAKLREAREGARAPNQQGHAAQGTTPRAASLHDPKP